MNLINFQISEFGKDCALMAWLGILKAGRQMGLRSLMGSQLVPAEYF
jgi:hypothetical protein